MVKVTVLYGHPVNPDAFEKYYAETHLPIAGKMPGVTKLELTKFISAPDGSQPAYYRQAELYFTSPTQLQETMSSAEGQAAAADLANFATGGVTMIIGSVEE